MQKWLSQILIVSCLCLFLHSPRAFAGYAVPGVYAPPPGYFADTFVIIDFDTSPDGGTLPSGTKVANQYQPLGVAFSLDATNPPTALLTINGPDSRWPTDTISPPNALVCTHDEGGHIELYVRIDFLDEMFPKGLPTAAGLVFTDAGQYNTFTLTAYNAYGFIVDSVTIDTADEHENSADHAEDTFCGVQYDGGISAIGYTTDIYASGFVAGIEIDNVYFSVPASPSGRKPDLRAEPGTVFTPTTVVPGQQLAVRCYVRNDGQADAAPCVVRFYASEDAVVDSADRVLGESSIGYTPPGGRRACYLNQRFPITLPAGDYFIAWVIDPDNDIDESNEDNNVFIELEDRLTLTDASPAGNAPDSGLGICGICGACGVESLAGLGVCTVLGFSSIVAVKRRRTARRN